MPATIKEGNAQGPQIPRARAKRARAASSAAQTTGEQQVDVQAIEYVRVVKSLFLIKVNALYTIDTHKCEALLMCRQMLL